MSRRVVLDVGGNRLEGLAITATAAKSQTSRPDPMDVTAIGLSEGTVAALRARGTIVRVLAGRGDDLVQIGAGAVVRGSVTDDERGLSADPATRWQVHDGGLSLVATRVSRVWSGRISADTIIRAVASDCGISVGAVRYGSETTYFRGWCAYGAAREVLDEVIADTDSVYAVQDDRLTIWPRGGSRTTSGYSIRADSGMVGSPRQVDDGAVEVTSILLPGMRPGDRYEIKARRNSGVYVARQVTHEVESRGPRFYTTVIGRPERG